MIVEVERQLQIKNNVLQRCRKELASYQKEANEQRAKISSLKEASQQSSDSEESIHLINKQLQVLAETEKLIPHCINQVEQAERDLKAFIEKHNITNVEI